MKVAVLLMAYGGPGSLDEVEPFLKHVLSREDLPPGMVQSAQKRYAQIGSRSPLLEITQKQARLLEEMLFQASQADDISFQVYIGMKHWHPFIHETVPQMVENGYDRLVGLCLAPQYSDYAVGGYFRRLRDALVSSGSNGNDLLSIESWHTHPAFIRAWVQNIRDSLGSIPPDGEQKTSMLFTAHSLPERLVPDRDPYPRQVLETAQAISDAVGWPAEHMRVCYQCVGRGGGAWLGPNLSDEVAASAMAGYRNLVVVPAGFVSDHVETLYDLDIDLRAQVNSLGMNLARVPSLNDSPLLIEALAKLVLGKVIDD